ncbi:DUF930 domain-containing protein [Hyphomicrobium sp. D-2]|uniref:DUF930 domain-containing protein n=1 Tax=Hyphomicrobium sp. D-2 TaxID=3041621 RepID=UPI0024552DEA|nr:DUF930 domain-containing protein [Hyphomicrobium sp. D-2]MDH4981534.1 DUF930 domain-containing protein [Hyphomicrobium sp. D-2]
MSKSPSRATKMLGEFMNSRIWLAAVLLAVPAAAQARSIADQLRKLDPEERAHQVCVIKGIDTIRRDGKLPKADRIKTSISGRATFTGGEVSTKGGAVRAKSHWYKLKFTCAVSEDQMKALSFKYEVGAEIPEDTWEDLGLWR